MEQYNNIPKNKVVKLENKINQKRGVKMEGNTNNKNQNNYMGGDFQYHLYNDIDEFISDNDSYSHLDRDNFIDNMEENPSYLAYVVEKTAEEVYEEETDVGGDGYIKLCQQIAIENVSSDILDDVIEVLWR